MSKYIIEIEEKPLCVFDKDTQTYFPRLWRVKGFNSLVFDEDGLSRLEELNSDYINEHFGDLQDTAYKKGLHDGESKCRYCNEYQRGLNEAWEAAKKLFSSMAESDIEKAFPTEWNNGGFNALINLQPQEAIEKLKAYEEKQKAKDEIEVGDEVVSKSGIKGILLEPETEFVLATIIVPSQRWRTIYDSHVNLEKTGKHYDIDLLMEEIKKKTERT